MKMDKVDKKATVKKNVLQSPHLVHMKNVFECLTGCFAYLNALETNIQWIYHVKLIKILINHQKDAGYAV